MVSLGLLPEEEALESPQAHVVTRWVGADPAEARPHVTRFEPPGTGVVLLCSDGLWNYQPEAAGLAGLAMPAAQADPLGSARALVQFAIDAGGRDNLTVALDPLPARHVRLPRRLRRRLPGRLRRRLPDGSPASPPGAPPGGFPDGPPAEPGA